jgi:hypothetical protein
MEYVESLFIDVSNELLNVRRRTFERPDEPGLIFPRYRDGRGRVSEQEAKHLFLYRLCSDGRCRFSVETPTCDTHGTGTRSGCVDVSLYVSGHQIDVHIEFKEGNREDVERSLAKLVREEKLGGWFHTLLSADRGTLPSVATKLIAPLHGIRHYVEDCSPHMCLFAFCIIERRRLFLRWLTLGGEGSVEQCEQAFRELTLDTSSWNARELPFKEPIGSI